MSGCWSTFFKVSRRLRASLFFLKRTKDHLVSTGQRERADPFEAAFPVPGRAAGMWRHSGGVAPRRASERVPMQDDTGPTPIGPSGRSAAIGPSPKYRRRRGAPAIRAKLTRPPGCRRGAAETSVTRPDGALSAPAVPCQSRGNGTRNGRIETLSGPAICGQIELQRRCRALRGRQPRAWSVAERPAAARRSELPPPAGRACHVRRHGAARP